MNGQQQHTPNDIEQIALHTTALRRMFAGFGKAPTTRQEELEAFIALLDEGAFAEGSAGMVLTFTALVRAGIEMNVLNAEVTALRDENARLAAQLAEGTS